VSGDRETKISHADCPDVSVSDSNALPPPHIHTRTHKHTEVHLSDSQDPHLREAIERFDHRGTLAHLMGLRQVCAR
jgi:hypothetical protein